MFRYGIYTGFICMLFCAIPSVPVSAQEENYFITTQHLSVEDGLASREIFCGVQDKLGFLWFGTRNGLNRYDGEKFLLFTSQHNHMQDNRVLQLAVDDSNRLFIGYGLSGYSLFPSGKVDVMDAVTQEVKSLAETFPGLPFKESEVFTIANDGTDNVVFLTVHPARLWYYSSKNGFRLRSTMPERNLNSVREFGYNFSTFWHGNMHIVSESRIHNYITPDTSRILVSSHDTGFYGPFLVSGKEIIPYMELHKEDLCGYAKIDGHGNVTWVDMPKHMKVSAIRQAIRSPTDTAMIAMLDDGIYSYSHSETIKLLDSGEISGYKGRIFSTSFFDRQGSRWLFSEGAIKVKLKPLRFRTYFTKQQQQTEANNQARGIYAGKGKVYANIWNHLFIQDGDKTTVLPSRDILYALIKFKDNIIAGGFRLMICNKEENSLAEWLSGRGGEIWSIIPLSDSFMLLGGSLGITRYYLANDSIPAVPVLNPDIPKPSFVYRFMRGKGMIWACAANGLYELDEKGDISGYYGNVNDKAHHLPFTDLFDFCIDKNGIFWLATNGEGLYRWDRGKNEFKQFTVADGLSSNIMYRIETDDYDNLWISSDYGLMRFNTRNYSIYTYTTNDGLSHNEFNRGSSFKAEDGRLFFGGLNGINAFYPKDMLSDTAVNETPLRITSFTKFSSKTDKLLDLTTDLIHNNKIVINKGDRFIELKFLLLDFEQGKKRYAYKIEGLDKDWNYTNDNSIHLSGLPYGKFTLRIKGQNSYGAWSKCELNIPLTVVTPYYRSIWFILSVALLVIAATYSLIYLRTRQLAAEKTKLEGIVDERTAQLKQSLELVAQEKKLGDELLLNILPGEVAQELKTTGSSAARYFDNVTVMFTDFVNFTSVSAGMSPQDLVNELDSCYKAFDAITSKYGIEKIKTVGDAYLAVGGLPVADPRHAAHVLAVAIDIRDFMAARKMGSGNKTFDIRIGVHSGSVVAGIVGIKKFAYDIWGDTVNTAARMEQNCEPGKINISETTFELVKDEFTCEYRGEIEVKGKGKMKMYFVG